VLKNADASIVCTLRRVGSWFVKVVLVPCINTVYRWISWSQWLCDLRHEPSSPARTLGSWVRIPLEAWISLCIYCVFVLFCV
jgi:hypothetical protein